MPSFRYPLGGTSARRWAPCLFDGQKMPARRPRLAGHSAARWPSLVHITRHRSNSVLAPVRARPLAAQWCPAAWKAACAPLAEGGRSAVGSATGRAGTPRAPGCAPRTRHVPSCEPRSSIAAASAQRRGSCCHGEARPRAGGPCPPLSLPSHQPPRPHRPTTRDTARTRRCRRRRAPPRGAARLARLTHTVCRGGSQAAENAKSHGNRLRRCAALPSNPSARWVTQGC